LAVQLFANHGAHHIGQLLLAHGIAQGLINQRLVSTPTGTRLIGLLHRIIKVDGNARLADRKIWQRFNQRAQLHRLHTG